MSEATPTPAEPPTPSAQQLAQWRTLTERIRQGDVASFTLVEKSEHNKVRSEIAEVGTLLGKLSHERAAGAIVVKGKTSI